MFNIVYGGDTNECILQTDMTEINVSVLQRTKIKKQKNFTFFVAKLCLCVDGTHSEF